MKRAMRRFKDIHDVTSANAVYIIKRICEAYGMPKPKDGEIELDSCYVTDYPHNEHDLTPVLWVRVSITAAVKGTWYKFGIDLAQSVCTNNTLCANMFMTE